MAEKKVPMRTCICCRQSKDKKELLRIVKTANGIVPDKTGKLNGRGAYICYDKSCLEKLRKTKALNRTFSCEVDEETYKRVEEAILSEN